MVYKKQYDDMQYTTIKQTITFNTEINTEVKHKETAVVFFVPTKQDGRSHKDIYNKTNEIKKEWTNLATTRNETIIRPVGISTEKFRKILEIIFRKTSIKVKVAVAKSANKMETNEENTNNILIIRNKENSTYAETVKKLTMGLQETNTLANIEQVRKTRRGEVLIKFIGEKETTQSQINNVLDQTT